MKQILIVTAHPSTVGHTHQIARAYAQESEALGHSVTVLDLYQSEQLPFFAFEKIKELPITPAAKRYQKLIHDATEIVFIHPVWWGTMPAILKNFLDHTLESRFAFRYIQGSPEGLLQGRRARVIVTAGIPTIAYALFLSPLYVIWRFFIVQYCGMRFGGLLVQGSMNSRSMTVAKFDRFLERVRTLAHKD